MLAPLRLLMLGACAGLAFSASSARSATTCYDETGFPAVVRIDGDGDAVRLVLGSSPSLVEQPPHPVLQYSRRTGWSVLSSLRCQGSEAGALCPRDDQKTGCAARIPAVSLSSEELAPLRPDLGSLEGVDRIEQVVGSCVESGPYLWFGLRFYAGEGITGAGGFGRMHAETGVVEIRRPAEVRPHSVDQVVHDGGTLYVATASHYECVGDPPAEGLLAYRWENDRTERVPTCGRVIHDVQLVGADLWVATDMGLSIGTLDPAEPGSSRRIWKHYEPRPELPEVMREASCLEIYAHVFEAPFRRSSSQTGLDPAGRLRAIGRRHHGDGPFAVVREQELSTEIHIMFGDVPI